MTPQKVGCNGTIGDRGLLNVMIFTFIPHFTLSITTTNKVRFNTKLGVKRSSEKL